MQIFKLFGRILVDNSEANDNLTDTEKKAQEAADAFTQMANEAGLMAGAVASAAAAIVAGLGFQAVNAADELKRSLNTLQAQTGASDEEMNKYRESILNLHKQNMGQGLEDIGKSISLVARNTGLAGSELENTTKNALALRDTFEFEVNESARAANSLMKQFGITADQAYTLIAQGAQQGANQNGDMLDVMSEFSVQFSALGFSAEQYAAVLVDGAKNGAFSISAVGDAMKEFNILSKDGSDSSAEAFQKLGLNAEKMTSAFNSGGESAQKAFTQVMQGLSQVKDPTEKRAIGVALFAAKYEDLEAKAIEALGNIQSKTNQNADTLKKINDVKYNTFGEALVTLGKQLEVSFFIPLGEKIMPKLNELMALIQEKAPLIEEKLGGAVQKLTGFFNALGDGLIFVIKNFKHFLPVITAVTAMIIAQFVINTLIPMYKAWRTAVVGLTIAQAALKAVTMATGFGTVTLVIGLVIAAIVALIMYWDTIKEKAISVWGWLTSFFKTKIGMIVAFMGGPITIAMMIIANWKKVKAMAISIWDWLGGFFKTKLGMIVAFLGGPITIGLMLIKNWDKVKAGAVFIWGALVAYFESIRDRISGIFGKISDTVKSVFSTLWGYVKKPLNLIITGLNTFITAYEKMINKVAGLINSIPKISIPSWVPGLGGKSFGIPKFPTIDFPEIPMLAEGGMISAAGSVLVGEEGPELLDLPRGAQVTPLDKASQSIVININDAKVFDTRDGERLGELIVKSLKMKGVVPRGV
jgi:TP901 family phage tail tape measure protein